MIPNWERKAPIPTDIPADMQQVIHSLKRSKSKMDCLKRAYRIVTKRFRGALFLTYSRFHRLYLRDVNDLWENSGFLHCTHQNFLLRILLIRSGIFKDRDIRLQKTLTYHFSPHQYLRVRVEPGRWVDVDPWASQYGIGLGDHAKGFNFRLRRLQHD